MRNLCSWIATLACMGMAGEALPQPPVATHPALLSTIQAMPAGSWSKVNVNAFHEVWVPEGQRALRDNPPPAAIVAAWSGFAWDTRRGDLLLYGGGHANYAGNEVYRWRSQTLLWERASLPSEVVRVGTTALYIPVDGTDAAPSSAHTYDNNIYLPVLDRFLTFGGASYDTGAGYMRPLESNPAVLRPTGPYFFDPSLADGNKVGGTEGSHVQRNGPHPEVLGGNMWQNRDHELNALGAVQPGGHINGCTGYAEEAGQDVVYVGATRAGSTDLNLYRYVPGPVNDPSQDFITMVGIFWGSTAGRTTCAFDPVERLFVRTGSSERPFVFWTVDPPFAIVNDQNVAMNPELQQFVDWLQSRGFDLGSCALDFDPVRRKYAVWCGDESVWMLTSPPGRSVSGWSISREQWSGGLAPDPASVGTGILGKWRYAPGYDVFIALEDGYFGNVWVYKPSGATAPPNLPPSIALTSPADGTAYAGPASVVLTASAADSDGSIAKVEFLNGTTVIATLTSPPYSFTWPSVPVGVYTLAARATDNQGATALSTPVTIDVQPPPVNVALKANGGTATASSTLPRASIAALNDGKRTASETRGGAGWIDATFGQFPDWVQVDFSGAKKIDRVDVFSVQDTSTLSAEPTPETTFSRSGVTSFEVQSWNGTGWTTVPGGLVTGNDMVWRTVVFPAVTTPRVRVLVHAAAGGYSQLAEVEAWSNGAVAVPNALPVVTLDAPVSGATFVAPASIRLSADARDGDGTVSQVEFLVGGSVIATDDTWPYQFTWSGVASGTYVVTARATDNRGAKSVSLPVSITVLPSGASVNVAAQSNGGVASASSSLWLGYPPFSANDGDRSGLYWTRDGGWVDATPGAFPDWLAVQFAGTKTINRIDVFTVQDAIDNPSPPTVGMTFTKFGITAFDVQTWNGSAWVTVPGGSVTGNANVWRTFTFPPIATDRARVLVHAGLDGYSRVVELEAWTTP